MDGLAGDSMGVVVLLTVLYKFDVIFVEKEYFTFLTCHALSISRNNGVLGTCFNVIIRFYFTLFKFTRQKLYSH